MHERRYAWAERFQRVFGDRDAILAEQLLSAPSGNPTSEGLRSCSPGNTSSTDSDQGSDHSIRDFANTVVIVIRDV